MNRILVERWSEILTLNRSVDDLCRGVGGLLMIEGQCGIGRTGLLFGLARLAGGRRLLVCTARSTVLEAEIPYGVLHQLLEAQLAPATAAEREPERGTRQPLTGAGLLCALEPGALPTGRSDLHGPVDFRVLGGVLRTVRLLAERAPVVLCVDDLNFCDPPSLRVLTYVVRRLKKSPVLIAVTRRLGEPDTAPSVMAALREAGPWTVLRPAPLSAAGTGELVDRVRGPAPASSAQQLHTLTAGNPLLLNALLNGLPPIRAGRPVAERLPEELARLVGGVVRARLAHLPPSVTRIAETVALLDGRAEPSLVAEAAGVTEPEFAGVLGTLCGMGLLSGGEPHAFAHPVVGAALRRLPGTVNPEELYGRLAALLHDRSAPPADIARQLLRTRPTGARWVPGTLRAAATEAVAAHRPAEARTLLLRTLGEPLSDRVRSAVQRDLDRVELVTDPRRLVRRPGPGLLTGDSPEDRAEAALTYAQALVRTGRVAQAVETIAECRGRLCAEPDAAARDGLLHRLDLAAALVARLRPGPSAPFRSVPAPASPARAAEGGAAGAPGAGAGLGAAALYALHTAAAGTAPADTAVRGLRALPVRAGHGAEEWLAQSYALISLLWADENELVERWCGTLLATAPGPGGLLPAVAALALRASARFEAGRLPEAEQDARHALDILGGDPGPADPLQALALVPLLSVLVETGRADEAACLLRTRGGTGPPGEALPETWPHMLVLAVRGRVKSARGDAEGALEDLMESGRRAAEWGGGNPAALRWRSDAALLRHHLGDTAGARRLVEEELRAAYAWGTPRAIGAALRAKGLLLRGADGTAALNEAVEVLRPGAAPLETAYALAALGSAQRRGNSRREARVTLRQALRAAQRLGAVRLAERVHRELLAAGALPRRIEHIGARSLTESERRVAVLAATGRTNGAIARELFITRRTVETHLTRAYRKLGIRGRSELGRALRA